MISLLQGALQQEACFELPAACCRELLIAPYILREREREEKFKKKKRERERERRKKKEKNKYMNLSNIEYKQTFFTNLLL
jgi:hypothetical protein